MLTSDIAERFRLYRDPTFRFEPGPHLTYLQDKILWSITGALRQSGLTGDSTFYTEEGRIRGTHVHAACHYLDEGDTDLDELQKLDDRRAESGHPLLSGYVCGWQSFKTDFHFIPRLIELPMYDDVLQFAGIPDREGLILNGEEAVVEIKTGAMKYWTAYQTAAQDILLQRWDEHPHFRRRFGVNLKPDGTYKIIEFTDPGDYDTFRAALRVSQAAGGIDRGVPPIGVLA